MQFHYSIIVLIILQDVTNDSFIMIVEGRVEILIGKEKIKCESGPFFYFGLSNLNAKQGKVEFLSEAN